VGLTKIKAKQISNLDFKQAARVVTVANVTLTGGAPAVVDGVSLLTNNRVLVTGQTDKRENGIYRVQILGTGEDGTWVRTTDADTTGEMLPGMVIMVTEGAVYADRPWKLTTNGAIIIGTTELDFELFNGGTPGGANTNIQFNDSGTFGGSANLTWLGDELRVVGLANIAGNVTADYFTGNGSQLTGISTSTNQIFNGTSNVDIAAANANITVSVDGVSNVVVISTDGITVSGNITGNGIPITTVSNVAPADPEQGDIWIDSDSAIQYIYFSDGDSAQWAEMEAYLSISSGGGTGGNVDLSAVDQDIIPAANITYDLGNATNRWRDIYLSGNTIYLGAAEISSLGGNLLLPATIQIGNAVLAEVNGALSFPQSLSVNTITATGNITANTFLGNVAGGTITASGNISGNNISGTLTTASQPNITGIGTLSSLAVTGNITAGNVNANSAVRVGATTQWSIDTDTDLASVPIAAVANTAGPAETIMVNRSDDSLAYAEFLAINDSGNIESGWCGIGINSSNYNDPGFPITGADDGFLLHAAPEGSTNSGNLVIGTGDTGTVNAIVFGAGGFATGNTQMVIIPDDRVEIIIPTESTSANTGALVVDGGLGVIGNVNVGGNLTVSLDSTITANNIIALEHVWSGPVEQWLIDRDESDTGRRIAAVADIPGPAETITVNLSDDTLAYSEFMAINDVGNITSGWISMGINSSTYNDPSFLLTGADDAYLLFEAPAGTAGAGNLVIGTGGEGQINAIVFGAGGFATGNTQMAIFPDDRVEIDITTESVSTGTGALVVKGGIGLVGNLNVGGSVNIVGNITLGGAGNTIDVSSLAVDDPLIYMGANNAADNLDLGFVGEYNDGTVKYTGLVRDATDAAFKFFSNVSPKPTSTIDFASGNLVYPTVVSGNLALNSGVVSVNTTTGALTVTGGAGITGNVHIGGLAQVTGNVIAGNLNTSGAVTGNGRSLTSLSASNLDTGTVPNARLSGTYSGITAVGTLSSLSVTGNVAANYFIGNGSLLTGVGGFIVSVISGNTTAQAGTLYVLTNTLTLTLPASPAVGVSVAVSNRSNQTNCIIARNGRKIMGDNEDLVINVLNAAFELIYIDTNQGWVLL